MSSRVEVLVAILNNRLDFVVARDRHWYRIPTSSVHKWLRDRWPPRWLAFYQTKTFGDEAFAVRYWARVRSIREAYRWQLFPDQPRDEKATRRYYQLMLDPLQRLPQPIISRRRRRIVFIPTTWEKFTNAVEINDLYHESPLEDRLWAELKRLQISAERQEFVVVNDRNYALDFAIHCALGNLDVETDGDTWHTDPERIPLDNLRDNDMETAGWKLLRFNTRQIHEQMAEYCLPTIVENVNQLGGVDEGGFLPRHIRLDAPGSMQQLGLFDSPPEDI
jgi:very-short-patch-repair endonuclease